MRSHALVNLDAVFDYDAAWAVFQQNMTHRAALQPFGLRHDNAVGPGHGVDSIQFYDNNFFLHEEHTREQMERLAPLGLKWWCEARIDLVLRYSDSTLDAIRRAGCKMIFFGAESGSDWVLLDMKKQLKTEQTLELASRIRQFGIIPEFSFVIGNPRDPERDTAECFQFVRRLKRLNPASEIILYPYIPVPQRDRMYGDVEGQMEFPSTPEEWAAPRWQNFAVRKSPRTPWVRLRPERRAYVD